MRLNLIVTWDKAPSSGRINVIDGKLAHSLINVGWGNYDTASNRFSFTSVDEMCRIAFAVDADAKDAQSLKTIFEVTDTARPWSVPLREVLRRPGTTLRVEEAAAEIYAEID